MPVEQIDFLYPLPVTALAQAGVVLPTIRVLPVGKYTPVRIYRGQRIAETSGFGSYDAQGQAILGIGCPEECQTVWRKLVPKALPFLSLEALQEAAAATARRALTEIHVAIGLGQIGSILSVIPVVQATAGYPHAHLVANGASEVLAKAAKVMGWDDKSEPTRMATCASGLPLGLAFEMRLRFSLRY